MVRTKKVAEACSGVMTSSVYLKLNGQRQNVIYSFYIIKKEFSKLSLVQPQPVVRPKDYRAPFFVIMICTKQSTPLAVDKAEMAASVVGLSSNRSRFSTNKNLERTLVIL